MNNSNETTGLRLEDLSTKRYAEIASIPLGELGNALKTYVERDGTLAKQQEKVALERAELPHKGVGKVLAFFKGCWEDGKQTGAVPASMSFGDYTLKQCGKEAHGRALQCSNVFRYLVVGDVISEAVYDTVSVSSLERVSRIITLCLKAGKAVNGATISEEIKDTVLALRGDEDKRKNRLNKIIAALEGRAKPDETASTMTPELFQQLTDRVTLSNPEAVFKTSSEFLVSIAEDPSKVTPEIARQAYHLVTTLAEKWNSEKGKAFIATLAKPDAPATPTEPAAWFPGMTAAQWAEVNFPKNYAEDPNNVLKWLAKFAQNHDGKLPQSANALVAFIQSKPKKAGKLKPVTA